MSKCTCQLYVLEVCLDINIYDLIMLNCYMFRCINVYNGHSARCYYNDLANIYLNLYTWSVDYIYGSNIVIIWKGWQDNAVDDIFENKENTINYIVYEIPLKWYRYLNNNRWPVRKNEWYLLNKYSDIIDE